MFFAVENGQFGKSVTEYLIVGCPRCILQSNGKEGLQVSANKQQTAKAVVEAMMSLDKMAVWLGVELVDVSPGRVVLRATVREDMLNGVDMCHGGVTFSLADVAFACACNSYNENMVAQTCTISFLAPSRAGDVLTATCEESLREGKSGFYDTKVTDQNGTVVAMFRGQSRAVPGNMIPPEDIK